MPLSVLVVDDNPHFLRVLSRFLTVHGAGELHVVGAVEGGRDAVAEAARLRPDLIVVDLNMPDVPGLQILPQLRRLLPDVRLIALSLTDPDEYRAHAVAAGADLFVSKVNLEYDLMPAIQHWLHAGSGRVLPGITVGVANET